MTVNETSAYPHYRGLVTGTYPSESIADGTPGMTGNRSDRLSPSYIVDISQRARERMSEAAAASPGKSSARDATAAAGAGESAPAGRIECKTCKNRKYQDVSNDSTVSFQTPTTLTPAAAESLVRAHEMEHVNHEQASAKESGKKVVSQSVAIHYGICPECGRAFVSGGTTTTVTRDRDATNPSNRPATPRGAESISVHA
jgi:hypothetical protein